MPSASAPVPTAGIRNAYVDLLRSASIVAVVLGHWLATGIVVRDGHNVGVDAITAVTWGSWATLALQVIPVFFLVGGYANAASWTRHGVGVASGQPWQGWVSARVRRLLVPTCWYLGFVAALVLVGQLLDADPRDLEEAGWALSLHLWFLAAYMIVLLATPVLHAAHVRWGWRVPTVMALSAVVIDTGVVDFRWHVVGWANYLLVWGCFHQLGFSWHDGRLSGARRGTVLAVAAAAALAALIWWGPYPVSMVGVPGARIANPSPPSTALLAFGLAQCGLAVALEPAASRWLERHRRVRSAADRVGALTMAVYLWHMVPVVVVVLAGYLSVVGDPAVGGATWWAQRPIWIAVLCLVLAALLTLLAQAVRLVRARRGSRPGRSDAVAAGTYRRPPARYAATFLVCGIVVAGVGIARLAIGGFAPDGSLDPIPLLAVALGLALVSLSVRRPPRRGTAGHAPAAPRA